MGMKYNSVPGWLEALLEEKFFDSCSAHLSAKKNEKNVFCLECCGSFCAHCLPLHPQHTLIQIRRYVYRDVLRLCDAQKLMNCSSVQPYTTNSEKVVFLNERPISKTFRGSGKFCNYCDRSLQPPFFFCSLSCKVHCLITSENGIQHELHGCGLSPSSTRKCGSQNLSDSDFESLGSLSPSTSSDPSGSAAVPATLSCKDLTSLAASVFTKKKRSYGYSTNRVLSKQRRSSESGIGVAINRRKSVPQSYFAGIEARGFVFGPPIALAIGAKFVPLRKPKKLPGEVIFEEYELGYGRDRLEMHVGAVEAGERALVVDDFIATGGTLCCQ